MCKDQAHSGEIIGRRFLLGQESNKKCFCIYPKSLGESTLVYCQPCFKGGGSK